LKHALHIAFEIPIEKEEELNSEKMVKDRKGKEGKEEEKGKAGPKIIFIDTAGGLDVAVERLKSELGKSNRGVGK
jgi:hypothetical protein